MSQSVTQTSRREFVAMLGAGLIIAVLDGRTVAQTTRRGRRNAAVSPDAPPSTRIHIDKTGAITVLVGKVECGQGARAELTAAAAEELRVKASQISLLMADTSQVPDDGITAGSGTTPRTVPAVRQAAACARELLITAAVLQWNLTADKVQVQDGKVREIAGHREISYADLVALDDKLLSKAAALNAPLTSQENWTILGAPLHRPNGREIVTGAHKYPSDIAPSHTLHARILRPPSYGAKLLSIDLDAAKTAAPDARILRDGALVAAVAARSHIAQTALDAVTKSATWEQTPGISSNDLYAHLAKNAKGAIENPFAADVKSAPKSLSARYLVPFVQHAPLEPRAACAQWEADKLTVWTGTQNPFGVRRELAAALAVPESSIRVIVPDFGGGFGGKHTGEAAVEAARLARIAGAPVSVRWSRAEEFTWAYFRPAGVIDAQASLDAHNNLASWHFVNINSGPASVESPYRASKSKSFTVPSENPLRPGSYRALAATANNFARESFIDELAHLAGKDPLQFRLNHLDEGRLKDVLREAAKRFNYPAKIKNLQPNTGVGIACGTDKGGYVAACVLIEIKNKTITLKKITQVFECGCILNPDNLMLQVQGALLMAIGPALREQMTFADGSITNAAFSQYHVPRFADLPDLANLEVHLLNRPDLPSAGAGECPVIALAPAINNALFAATAAPHRQLPLQV